MMKSAPRGYHWFHIPSGTFGTSDFTEQHALEADDIGHWKQYGTLALDSALLLINKWNAAHPTLEVLVMKMRVTIKKSDGKWIGEYNLPSGQHVMVSTLHEFEFFCKMLRACWKNDVRRAQYEGWPIKV